MSKLEVGRVLSRLYIVWWVALKTKVLRSLAVRVDRLCLGADEVDAKGCQVMSSDIESINITSRHSLDTTYDRRCDGC